MADRKKNCEWRRKMALGKENTKFRVLAVERMVLEGRKLTTYEIQRRLEQLYGIQADLRTIRGDLYAIDRFIPLESEAGRNGGFKKVNFEEVFADGK